MIVCIDIGGGTTRIGLSKNKKTFEKIIRFPTEDSFENEVNKMISKIKAEKATPKSIVIAASGSVDKKKGIIISWGQKKSWWGKNIFKPLSEEFINCKFLIENDANLGALGESVFGTGKGYSSVGYVTLSSGVGGCLIVNKQIMPYAFGLEPAHQIVNFTEKKVWSCGQKGCFEAYASGTAFKQIFKVNPEDCTNQKIWDKYTKLIAVGFANLICLWSPQILVIGGGVVNKYDYFIEPLKKELKRLLPMYKIPEISKNKLNEAGLYGGLYFAQINNNQQIKSPETIKNNQDFEVTFF